jgi:hypothetical protein
VLIKRLPARGRPARGRLCGAAFWDCPSTTWSFGSRTNSDQKERSRLRAGDRHAESDRLGLAGQSARQRYNAERRDKGMNMLKITPPVAERTVTNRLDCAGALTVRLASVTAAQEEARTQLVAKLQPERIRATLAFAGLYQIAHAMIQQAVLEQVRLRPPAAPV